MLKPNLGLTLLLPGADDGRFPWSTFAANALGCLLIGLLSGMLSHTATPDTFLSIRTRYPNECHNFFGDRISAPQRMAVQGTHQRIVPISRPFLLFISTKSATLQFCSVALSLRTDGQCKKRGYLWKGVMV